MNAATVRSYGSFVAAMATPDLVNLIAAAAEELAKRGPLDEEEKNDDAKPSDSTKKHEATKTVTWSTTVTTGPQDETAADEGTWKQDDTTTWKRDATTTTWKPDDTTWKQDETTSWKQDDTTWKQDDTTTSWFNNSKTEAQDEEEETEEEEDWATWDPLIERVRPQLPASSTELLDPDPPPCPYRCRWICRNQCGRRKPGHKNHACWEHRKWR